MGPQAFFWTLVMCWLALPAQAIHTYLTDTTPLCVYEDLPRHTLYVGHYSALGFNPNSQRYESNPGIGVVLTVEETFDSDHRVIFQKGSSSGKLTFTAADAGQHKICFTLDLASNAQQYLSAANGRRKGIKFDVDAVVGEDSNIQSSDKEQIDKMLQRAKDIVARLNDVHREQALQREREAEFRNLSESVNAKATKWTIVQVVVLLAMSALQIRYLKNFFVKEKVN